MVTATIQVFDYDGYSVETLDAEAESLTFQKAKEIQSQYQNNGVDLQLSACRDIAIFECDEDLYFDDSLSPDGLDSDHDPVIAPEGMSQSDIESAVMVRAISDAYGCAVNCKPHWADAEPDEFGFPGVNAWFAWHMEAISE